MVIGITGGMGCGKSTVGGIFEDFGFVRCDVDSVVRDLLSDDVAVKAEVVALLGAEVLDSEGELDRQRVAEKVFSNEKKLTELENILHPRAQQVWQKCIAEHSQKPICVEIPLLFEKNLEKHFQFTVCVGSSFAKQLIRLRQRGFSDADSTARIARQLPLSEKLDRADFVISNEGSLSFLTQQIALLLDILNKTS